MTRSDDGSIERAPASPASAEATNPASVPAGHSWAIPAKVYAFSAFLALAAAALWTKGPFLGDGPIRHLINQPEMLVVVCVLAAAAAWQPVVLHYRGNSYNFVLGEVPLLLGLVFLSPRLFLIAWVSGEAFVFLFLSKKPVIKVAFNMASGAFLRRSRSSSSATFSEHTVLSAFKAGARWLSQVASSQSPQPWLRGSS